MWQWQGGAVAGCPDAYGAGSWPAASSYEGARVEPGRGQTREPRRSASDPTWSGQRRGPAQDVVPGSFATARGDGEPTPIFQAMASEWERHQRDDVVGDAGHRPGRMAADEGDHFSWMPAPRAATGPLPVQRPRDASGTRDLPAVPVVPPPPRLPHGAWGADVASHRPSGARSGERDQSGCGPEPRSGSGPLPVQRSRDASGRDLGPVNVVPPPPARNRSTEEELTHRAQRRRRPLATTTIEGGRHALKPRDEDEPTLREDLNTLGAARWS